MTRRGVARVPVTRRDEQAAGYYPLSAASIMRSEAVRLAAQAIPQQVPAVLLSRLAVSQQEQGRGRGRHPWRDAIRRHQSPRRSAFASYWRSRARRVPGRLA